MKVDLLNLKLTNKTNPVKSTNRESSSKFNDLLTKENKAVGSEVKTDDSPKDSINSVSKESNNSSKENSAIEDTENPLKKEEAKSQEVKVEDNNTILVEETNNIDEVNVLDLVSMEDIEGIFEEIADLLGISVLELNNMLENLNLTLKDLSNSENLLNLIKGVLNIEDNAELLNVNDLNKTLQSIKDILVQNKDIISKLPDTIQKDILPIIHENTNMNIDKRLAENETNTTSITNSINISETLPTEVLEENSEENTDSEEETPKFTSDGQNNTGVLSSNSSHGIEFNVTDNGIINTSNLQSQDLVNISTVRDNLLNATNQLIDGEDIANQLVKGMKVELNLSNTSEIKIMLRPESLGEVSLKLATDNGVITAQFVAESQRIKEIIESNFNMLRNALAEQGVEVSSLEVSVRQDNNGQMNNSSDNYPTYSNVENGVAIEEIDTSQNKTNYLGNDSTVSYKA